MMAILAVEALAKTDPSASVICDVQNTLVNNIFNVEYNSNGYFYTYDDDFSVPGTITTIEGAGFYPQAGINFLAGITLKF